MGSPSVWMLRLYYFFYFAASGLYAPYFSLYLARHGLDSAEVTQILAIGPMVALFVHPCIALLADVFAARTGLIRLASVGAALAFSGFLFVGAAAWVPSIMLVYFVFRTPISTLLDATANEVARAQTTSYGAFRVWGSLGCLVATGGGGLLLEWSGTHGVLLANAAVVACFALVSFGLPRAARHVARERVLPVWTRLLGDRRMLLFLVVVILAQAAAAGYEACYSLHLRRLGLDGRWIGAAWVIALASEVAMMAVSGRILARFGAQRVLVAALAVAAARWFVMAHLQRPPLLLVAQSLHGVSFGLFYVAMVTWSRTHAGREASTAAQGMLTTSYCLGLAVGTFFAGTLFDAGGARLLFASASAIAALAALCACRLGGPNSRP